MAELKKLQQKRIGESFFEEDETVQLKISSITNLLTTLIKKSECKLKELGQIDTGDDPCNDQSKSATLLMRLISQKEHDVNTGLETQDDHFQSQSQREGFLRKDLGAAWGDKQKFEHHLRK